MSDLIRSSPDEARRRVDRIRGHVASAWEEVIAAYKHRDHEVLGYGSGTTGWDAYILGEFGESRLSLPKHQRVSHVIEASSEGMSNRAIASAAGVTEGTVRNDIQSEVRKNYAPAPAPRISDGVSTPSAPSPTPAPSITGMDGKEYSRPEPMAGPAKPKAEPITTQFSAAVVELNKILDKFHRIQNNPNFPANKSQVATLHGNDLARSVSELQNLADQLH